MYRLLNPTCGSAASHFLSVGTAAAPASRRLPLLLFRRNKYSDAIVEHYNKPRNVGSLPKSDPNVGTGLVGAPACGDVMKFQIQVNPATNVIEKAVFKTFGCGSAIASSSVATEWVHGKTIDEVMGIKNSDIAKHLSLPPVKLHCSMLAEDAIKAAVRDYQNKNAKNAAAAAAAATTGQ